MAATAIVPEELGSAGDINVALADAGYTAIPADGLIFPNDDLTFVLLRAPSSASTVVCAPPAATFRTSYGDITLPTLSVALAATGDMGALKIPTSYNVAGQVTITESGAGSPAIAKVYRLARY